MFDRKIRRELEDLQEDVSLLNTQFKDHVKIDHCEHKNIMFTSNRSKMQWSPCSIILPHYQQICLDCDIVLKNYGIEEKYDFIIDQRDYYLRKVKEIEVVE